MRFNGYSCLALLRPLGIKTAGKDLQTHQGTTVEYGDIVLHCQDSPLLIHRQG